MFNNEYTENEIAKGKENILAGAFAFALLNVVSALHTDEDLHCNGSRAQNFEAATCFVKQNPFAALGMAGVTAALYLNTRQGRAAAYNMLPGFLKAKQDAIAEQEEPVLRRSARLKN